MKECGILAPTTTSTSSYLLKTQDMVGQEEEDVELEKVTPPTSPRANVEDSPPSFLNERASNM